MSKKITPPQIISLEKIQSVLPHIDVFNAITKGFIAFSNGEAVIPPVGELLFDQPPGDVHIKYGYIKSQPYYVVKIASGFYNNALLGIPNSQGLNLIFNKNTGVLCAVILDEGHLTDVRTAVAGAIATQALAPTTTKRIGIIGIGIQGQMQLEYHKKIMDFEAVYYWNRDFKKAQDVATKMNQTNCPATAVDDIESLCKNCNIIITTTPSTSFLIKDQWIQQGTHITAIGSDTADKIELDPTLLHRADIVTVDSLSQSESRGEVFRARQVGTFQNENPLELGRILNNKNLGRQNNQQITIADLTGVAVQDLMISQAVFEKTVAK